MENQRKNIDDTFLKWRGNHEQIDDVCIFGLRINFP